MSRDDGGPAFPGAQLFHRDLYDALRSEIGVINAAAQAKLDSPGMSLRDYFAGQALGNGWAGSVTQLNVREIGERAYMIADAMLAARTPESEARTPDDGDGE